MAGLDAQAAFVDHKGFTGNLSWCFASTKECQGKGVSAVQKTMSNSDLIFGPSSLTPRDILEMIESSDMESRCRRLGTFRLYPVIGDEYCSMARRFVAQRAELLTRFLSGEAVERELIQQLIGDNLDQPSQVSTKAFFEKTDARDQARTATILGHLSTLPARDSINILGYGADSCTDERRVAEHLLELGICKKATIFRYNPFSRIQNSDVTDLRLNELEEADGPAFDVILAFWTLHHVFPELRWSEFGAGLKRIAPMGSVVILEEGDVESPSSASPAARAFYFMMLCKDIIVNRALRPEWFSAPESFYARYLSNLDMQTIEGYLPRPARRHRPSEDRQGVVDETLLFYDVP
ncbi:hypothetical protein [Micromonospora chokoriensis]|uniref:hypothetical protein n=1 Tax=Micromonospora chokoriensis TaxID=356851 RepID=UPI0012F9F55A|nr:hypothetical protein [Micromonospora chokoriensis]